MVKLLRANEQVKGQMQCCNRSTKKNKSRNAVNTQLKINTWSKSVIWENEEKLHCIALQGCKEKIKYDEGVINFVIWTLSDGIAHFN